MRTRVGYAGGTSNNPTYFNLDGHSESIQVDYDPIRISYDELMEVFWDSHDPTVQSRIVQYMSLIFYHNQEQEGLALASKEREKARLGVAVLSKNVSFSEF